MTAKAKKHLDEDEMIAVLEDLIRSGPDHAKVAAIRQLREMRREREGRSGPPGMRRLYDGEGSGAPPRRRRDPAR